MTFRAVLRCVPSQQERQQGRELDTAGNHYILLEVRTNTGVTGIGRWYTRA
jgi:hypothetical protein